MTWHLSIAIEIEDTNDLIYNWLFKNKKNKTRRIKWKKEITE